VDKETGVVWAELDSLAPRPGGGIAVLPLSEESCVFAVVPESRDGALFQAQGNPRARENIDNTTCSNANGGRLLSGVQNAAEQIGCLVRGKPEASWRIRLVAHSEEIARGHRPRLPVVFVCFFTIFVRQQLLSELLETICGPVLNLVSFASIIPDHRLHATRFAPRKSRSCSALKGAPGKSLSSWNAVAQSLCAVEIHWCAIESREVPFCAIGDRCTAAKPRSGSTDLRSSSLLSGASNSSRVLLI